MSPKEILKKAPPDSSIFQTSSWKILENNLRENKTGKKIEGNSIKGFSEWSVDWKAESSFETAGTGIKTKKNIKTKVLGMINSDFHSSRISCLVGKKQKKSDFCFLQVMVPSIRNFITISFHWGQNPQKLKTVTASGKWVQIRVRLTEQMKRSKKWTFEFKDSPSASHDLFLIQEPELLGKISYDRPDSEKKVSP